MRKISILTLVLFLNYTIFILGCQSEGLTGYAQCEEVEYSEPIGKWVDREGNVINVTKHHVIAYSNLGMQGVVYLSCGIALDYTVIEGEFKVYYGDKPTVYERENEKECRREK